MASMIATWAFTVVSRSLAGVTGLGVGDPVYGLNDWFGDGTQAEFCLARASEVAAKPKSVDHVVAASAPISALTTWPSTDFSPSPSPINRSQPFRSNTALNVTAV